MGGWWNGWQLHIRAGQGHVIVMCSAERVTPRAWQGLRGPAFHAPCLTPPSPSAHPTPTPRSMTEFDGTCSLRLRTPCEWDGVVYEAVTAVAPVPLLSGGWPEWLGGRR